MNTFDDDMDRGYLETGEPLEALYGTGWWTPMPEPEDEYETGGCPYCGGNAWFYGGEFCDCTECGKNYDDVRSERIKEEERNAR